MPVPSAVCPAVCWGVGWLPPSRSARSPVTQPSPCWPGARPPGEGPPFQTQTACIDMSMFPGLFTALDCRALAESSPRKGINHNSERNDNSFLNSWPRRVSMASPGRVIHSSSCTKCRIPWNRILIYCSQTLQACESPVILCRPLCVRGAYFWGGGGSRTLQ